MQTKKVNLTIDSRIISHLGEALIDNEKIALLELIKNASDADANNCNIEIDTLYQSPYGQGRMIIEDDGNGMTPFILEEAFLKIATSFKANHQKISPKFKRQAQGNKGIGRLSLNQLGKYVSVVTKVDLELINYISEHQVRDTLGYENSDIFLEENDFYYYQIDIDWERYNHENKPVENVKLDLQTGLFNETIFTHNKNHGTKIEVLGLKGIDFWQSNQTKKEIEQDVLEFLNPYLDEKYNFYVKINLDNRTFSSNKYDITDIENNYLSKVNFSFSLSNEKFVLDIERSKRYIDHKVKQLRSNLENWELDSITEIPFDKYYKEWRKKQIVIDLSSVENANISAPNIKFDRFLKYKKIVERKADEDKPVEKFYLPGDFKGAIYGFDLSSSSPVSKGFRKVLEEIRGVKLYRNNFRIFPYGSKNNDWLEMSDFNQRHSGVIYKQHSSTGFINIDGQENLERLKELTNRQGLVLNNYGTNFILIIQKLLYISIARDDKNFTEYFNFNRRQANSVKPGDTIKIADIEFKKRVDEVVEADDKASRLVENYDNLTDSEKKIQLSSLKESTTKLRSTVELREKQVASLEKNIEDFAPIMGATIVAETLAHEIIRLSNNINFYASNARKATQNNEKETILSNLNRIDSSNKFLLRYASLLDVNSYSRRRKYTVGSLNSKLNEILKESPLLTYGDSTLNYKISGTDFKVRMDENSFKIIIENLLINSAYWLDKFVVAEPVINFNMDANLGKLIVFDNGVGIDKSVESNLFQEFVSNKPNGDGRGMGLYIVTSLLNEIGATISLDSERNGHGNLYKFIITFPDGDLN